LRQYKSAGFRSIQEFFDQAFEQHFLHQVDLALRRKAIEKFSKLSWKIEVKLFYNLDNRILASKDYETGNTAKLLEEFCFAKDALCFEISERHKLQDELNSFKTLNSYQSQGFKIAIDDFGTGFSGLQVFYYTEPDIVKESLMTLKTKKNTKKIGRKCPSHCELGKRKVASKCPRCGTIHKINMLWIGRGMPRIFCPDCRSFACASSETALEHCEVSYTQRRYRLRSVAPE